MSELTIKSKDWIGIFIIGLIFSATLSILGYRLLSLSLYEGAKFGLTLGFFITLYSFILITGMNRFILPRISRYLWNIIAIIFSFLAGFLGTYSTHWIALHVPIAEVPIIAQYPFSTASSIGILTYLIGALNYRFVRTRNEKEMLDRLWMQSRIRSLETQLNPHFLFNAINSLAELIHRDPNTAETVLLKISSFLRSTMKEATLIPLSEEIRNAQEYIDLENFRFGGLVSFTIEGEIPPIQVPKFSIQLLCENALKHGYTAHIPFKIKLFIQDIDGIVLEVCNNGKEISNPQFGIGLSNLNERLYHLCKGELLIKSTLPPCYIIRLKECYENPHR